MQPVQRVGLDNIICYAFLQTQMKAILVISFALALLQSHSLGKCLLLCLKFCFETTVAHRPASVHSFT